MVSSGCVRHAVTIMIHSAYIPTLGQDNDMMFGICRVTWVITGVARPRIVGKYWHDRHQRNQKDQPDQQNGSFHPYLLWKKPGYVLDSRSPTQQNITQKNQNWFQRIADDFLSKIGRFD